MANNFDPVPANLDTIQNEIYGSKIRMAIHSAIEFLHGMLGIIPVTISKSDYEALSDSEKHDPQKIYFIHKDGDESKSIGIGYGGTIFNSGSGSTAKASPYQPMYGMCIPNV